MIRAADSASWTNFRGDILKYASTLFGFGYVPTAGRDQLCYTAQNCSAIYTWVLDQQTSWWESFSFFVWPANPTLGPGEVNIRSWAIGSSILATITLSNDSKLRIYLGGDGMASFGTLMYVSQTVLPTGTWVSIDLAWTFPGGMLAGTCSLYINDLLDTNPSTPGAPSVPNAVWGGTPDRFSIVMYRGGVSSSNTGWSICDLVVNDAQGAYNNSRLGPCRVEFLTFTQDQFVQWTAQVQGSPPASQYLAINSSPSNAPPPGIAPPGDVAYINPSMVLTEDLFGIASVNCYASILAVCLNACVRDPLNGEIQLICRPIPSNGMDVVIGFTGGSHPPSPPSYAVVQAVSEVDQSSLTFPWLDGSIENAWWGVNVQSGNPFVDQLFLEKVTTRRAVPYNCGQIGSYCIGGS